MSEAAKPSTEFPSQQRPVPRFIASVPVQSPPQWAVLQRRLFDVMEDGWRELSARFCEEDGRLRFSRAFTTTRDGSDDFYEPFFNWPALYMLGGSDELLEASKHHWRGITAQMTEAGFVVDELERGYDWFHNGESLIFFYSICAADPDDAEFRERARKFAEVYLPGGVSYDEETNIIGAPHNGSMGLRPGLGDEWETYPANQPLMAQYGLPLHHVPGIVEWDDLDKPGMADAMGQAMQSRMGNGDVPMNLAATSLAANAWLYDGDEKYADWIKRYVDGWVDRAETNSGVVPDNVGLDGTPGGMHEGRWYGGHYGWTWPHGIASIGMGTLIAGQNAAMVTGDDSYLELSRTPLDLVIEKSVTEPVSDEKPLSLRGSWMARMGNKSTGLYGENERPGMLVPMRYGQDGWFDHGPMLMAFPTWLWWWTGNDQDTRRLERVLEEGIVEPQVVADFRDKEEAGHEAPWVSYLWGANPDYPERALTMALGQVNRRMDLMDHYPFVPATSHIHYWQSVNPVVTEILTQLTTGAPPALYNGGLQYSRVRYYDRAAGRPGLPPEVAALVSKIERDSITLELVNLSIRRVASVVVQAGAFGEDRIDEVEATVGDPSSGYPGLIIDFAAPKVQTTTTTRTDVSSNRIDVELPPRRKITLTLTLTPKAFPARHQPIPGRRG